MSGEQTKEPAEMSEEWLIQSDLECLRARQADPYNQRQMARMLEQEELCQRMHGAFPLYG